MNRMPPHIENMIRKNPNAVLTQRGIVLKRSDRIDELLNGIPNADTIYGEHFDEIRAEQAANLQLASEPAAIVVEETKQEAKQTDKLPEEATASEDNDTAGTEGKESSEKSELESDEDDKPVPDALVDTPVAEDVFQVALAEARANPKYKDLTEEELVKRVQMSIAAKERLAKKKAEAEAAK